MYAYRPTTEEEADLVRDALGFESWRMGYKSELEKFWDFYIHPSHDRHRHPYLTRCYRKYFHEKIREFRLIQLKSAEQFIAAVKLLNLNGG